MRRGLILLFSLFLLAPTYALARHAEETLTPPGGAHPLPFEAYATVLSSTLDETVVEISIDPERPELLSESHSAGLGLVAVAHTGRIQAVIVSVEAAPVSNAEALSQMADISIPEGMIRLGVPGIFRDLRVVELSVAPCWKTDGQLLTARRVVVRIENIGGVGENEKTRPVRPVSPAWEALYQRHVLNYDSLNLPQLIRGTGNRYIVISRTFFDDETPQFITWKRRQGYGPKHIRLEDLGHTNPTTNAAMDDTKDYILNAYNTWSETPEFVVLVGDMYSGNYSGSLWTKSFYNYFYSQGYRPYDQWYALLEGNDVFPDVMVGRFPDSNTERMDYLLSKTVWYEKQPYDDGSAWQKRAIMTLDSYQEQQTITTKTQISNLLSAWGMTVSNHLNSNFGGILGAINSGVTFYNYRGHYCDSRNWGNTFDSYDVPYVNNTKKVGVFTVISCSSASFDYSSTSTAELMLRRDYNDPTNPKGAVAFIGSQAYTSYLYNNPLDKGFYYAWTDSGFSILGQAFVSAKIWAWNHMPGGYDPNRRDCMMKEYTILGDPTLQVWTDVPTAMSVSTDPTTIPVGQVTDVDVTVTTTTRAPIPGALVCLWKGTETYIFGYTNAAGIVTLPVEAITEGTVKLTVTAYNRIPHLSDVPAGGLPAPENVEAQAIGNHIRLTWSPVEYAIVRYDVYSDTAANFTIGPSTLLGSTTTPQYDDLGVVGDPAINHFYSIVAVSTGGPESLPSTPVGEFDFETQ